MSPLSGRVVAAALLWASLAAAPASADDLGDMIGQVFGQPRPIPPPATWRYGTTETEALNRIGSPTPFIRSSVTRLTPQQQTILAGLIREYLNDRIVNDHITQVSHERECLFNHHDFYIYHLEKYIDETSRGVRPGGDGRPHPSLRAFLPLPYWAPGTPIVDDMFVPDRTDAGRERARPPINATIMELMAQRPDNLEYPAVCRYANDADLARATDGWHGGVHNAVGGCMSDITQASAMPLFWLWHAYVSQIREQWKLCPRVSISTYAVRCVRPAASNGQTSAPTPPR